MDIWLPKMIIKTVDADPDIRLDARMKDLFYNDNIKGTIVYRMCLNNSLAMIRQYGYTPKIEYIENTYYRLFEEEIEKPSGEFLEYLNKMIDCAFNITYLVGSRNEFPYTIKLNVVPNDVDTNIIYLTKDAIQKGVRNHLNLMFAYRGGKVVPR